MYFAPSDLRVPRVDRHCTVRFCEAVAQRGWDVELVSLSMRLEFDEPTRGRNLLDVYDVETPFRVTVVPSRARQSREQGRAAAVWRAIAYPLVAARRLLVSRRHARPAFVVLYCKNYLLALTLLPIRLLLGRRGLLLFEVHLPPASSLGRFVLSRADGVVAISRVLARELQQNFGVPVRRVRVANQGVNLPAHPPPEAAKRQLRSELRLPARKLVVYTGKVYAGYGEIDYLLEAAKLFPPGFDMVIVGGREDQVRRLRSRLRSEGITNVILTGFVTPADARRYQAAADVLVSYYPGDLPLNKYRSPGKLFEYMAANRPIVTADYPFVHDLLSDGAVRLVEPDRPDLLAEALVAVVTDEERAQDMSRRAFDCVREFTWERRSERIEDFVAELTTS
jgi:glycosyltransferase involved in cell wall biosynthesis